MAYSGFMIGGLTFSLLGSMAALGQSTVVVAVPAMAGAVEGTDDNSDAFIWRVFTEIVAPVSQGTPSPVVFETWASDEDTFSTIPHWPKIGGPLRLQESTLEVLKTLDPRESLLDIQARTADFPCKAPVGAAVGGFPTNGNPPLCGTAELVVRNRPQFDYIVSNNLNTQAGLASAYAKSLNVEMPPESIAVKVSWVPSSILLQWIPSLGDISNIRKLYYVASVNSVEYALVAMHVSSRRNPNWVWGTFEHQKTPGRCDFIGCFDSFGAQIPAVFPNKTAVNTQYGSCPKTQKLKTLMAAGNLSPVWDNYCLKSTQVDYVAPDGTPSVLGNSVIEGIVGNGSISASSCIGCHVYASFGPTGKPTASAKAILPFNPTGKPIPGVLAGSLQSAFMWGVLKAPGP